MLSAQPTPITSTFLNLKRNFFDGIRVLDTFHSVVSNTSYVLEFLPTLKQPDASILLAARSLMLQSVQHACLVNKQPDLPQDVLQHSYVTEKEYSKQIIYFQDKKPQLTILFAARKADCSLAMVEHKKANSFQVDVFLWTTPLDMCMLNSKIHYQHMPHSLPRLPMNRNVEITVLYLKNIPQIMAPHSHLKDSVTTSQHFNKSSNLPGLEPIIITASLNEAYVPSQVYPEL